MEDLALAIDSVHLIPTTTTTTNNNNHHRTTIASPAEASIFIIISTILSFPRPPTARRRAPVPEDTTINLYAGTIRN